MPITTWPDFDEDGLTDRTIVGLDGSALLCTCEGVKARILSETRDGITMELRFDQRTVVIELKGRV